jgi:hypothetical protein
MLQRPWRWLIALIVAAIVIGLLNQIGIVLCAPWCFPPKRSSTAVTRCRRCRTSTNRDQVRDSDWVIANVA